MGNASTTLASGSSKGSSKTESGAATALMQLAQQFTSETGGVRQGLISQFDQILKTGGAQATIPLISKSVEASKQATSNTLKQTGEELARTGLAGTPFGEMIKAQTLEQGNLATSQIPSQISQQILQMIPNFILGQSQTASSGLAGAIPGMQRTDTKGSSVGHSTTGTYSYGGGKGGGG